MNIGVFIVLLRQQKSLQIGGLSFFVHYKIYISQSVPNLKCLQ